ncbi:MAG: alcohol dehydrogenase catalytic domain-containing protein [Nitrosotalea sp.]
MTHSKMHAAMFYGPSNMVVEESPFSLGKNEAALKIDACAVCGYDARVFRNGHRKVKPPVILGHEICGRTLQAINTPDRVLSAGTRVVVLPIIPCLNCWYCNNQQYNLCNNVKELGSTINGGFAEYVKIPEPVIKIGGLVPVPDNLSNEEASLLEPLACCLNGFSRLGQIKPDDVIVIVGDGPIGLLHLQLAKKLYKMRAAVVGKIPFRMQMAQRMEADAVFTYGSDTVKDVLDFTCGRGANLVVVATSNPEALNFATKIAAKNSKINLFASFSNCNSFSSDPNWIHYNQVSITGSFSSTPVILRKAVKLVSDGEIDLSKMVTNRYSLSEIEDAISATEGFHGLRAVVNKF